jgi:hypothetical protein
LGVFGGVTYLNLGTELGGNFKKIKILKGIQEKFEIEIVKK